MKISEYIDALEAIRAEHGDLDVQTYCPFNGRKESMRPRIENIKILRGRERKKAFWSDWDAAERMGEKVCRT